MVLHLTEDISIPEKKLAKIIGDPRATARAVKLIYVTHTDDGIVRHRSGKSFRYTYQDKPVKKKDDLQRIKSLVLPPAWQSVWICPKENGHLQATGLDAAKRKQYRYHPLWNQLRNQTKFYRMLEFGKALPAIRKQTKKDLASPGLSKKKVLATVVSLMELTSIRVGSDSYEKLYGSFGLTTLKDKHVNIKGTQVKFTFRGKKGVEHDISIQSKKLAKIVRQCRDIPGKELFQYYDEAGKKQTIDSGMVNEYIHNIMEKGFTTKDFRTWAGTVQAITALQEMGEASSVADAKKKIVGALDIVSHHLGNTRTVCKKYYVHPSILDMYEQNKLLPFLNKHIKPAVAASSAPLSHEEKMLMKILEEL